VWVVGVYLCWGFGLTWAVAWGVAWAAAPADQLRYQEVIENDHRPARLAHIRWGFGVTQVYFSDYTKGALALGLETGRYTPSGLPWFVEHAVSYLDSTPQTGPYYVAAYGWPLRALAVELWVRDVPPERTGGGAGYEEFLRGAVVIPGGRLRRSGMMGEDDLWLPLLPLWRGLIANVLFYASLVLVLRRGFVLLRGRRRRRRGRCWWRGGCGYDLTGLHAATCPECGRPVAPTKSPQRQRRVGPGKGAG